MAFRAALHQAGAAALSQLLQFPEPAAGQRTIACPCGQSGALPGTALQAHSHCAGRSGSVASLVSVPALSQRPVPRRSPTGH